MNSATRCITTLSMAGLIAACGSAGTTAVLSEGTATAGTTLRSTPVATFAERNPGSDRTYSMDGRTMLHASGFTADMGVRVPEAAARAFLEAERGTFGLSAGQTLEAVAAPAPGTAGAVHFVRKVSGLPIFDGNIVVGVDGNGRVFLVNATEVSSWMAGHHALEDGQAASIALGSFGQSVEGAGPAAVARGWRTSGGELRAVYQVDFIAGVPAGDWRVFVDGETGRALFRFNRRMNLTAQGKAYEVSPAETAASICPTNAAGTALTFCASPITVTLPNLSTVANLTGTQITAYNCKGTTPAINDTSIPPSCPLVVAVSGAFSFTADTTWVSPIDDFAAANVYYHLDKHASFFKALDPSLPPVAVGKRALRGSLPALVNAFENNAPMNNAFYSPTLDGMVFGQGTTADFTYDGTVAYHEFTHGVVAAWGGFVVVLDPMGLLWEPSAVNEGTADSMASGETGRSQMAGFITSTRATPTPYMRNMSDPTAARSCRGDGTLVTQLTVPNVVNGMDGEEHDDGEIWNGFYWEVYSGLKAANVKGCSGTCDAGPAIQYKALQLAAGTSPTFDSYWKTFKSAASALFPNNPAVATYVDCVARRRGFDLCNRTLPLYGNEQKAQYVAFAFSPFQFTVNATGAGAKVTACSGYGRPGTLYARNGSAVQVNTTSGVVTATKSVSVQACATPSSLTLDTTGTWYLLFQSGTSQSGTSDTFLLLPGATGVATRPTRTTPPICTYSAASSVVISPANPTVAAGGTQTFTASGGSGTGYVWSLTSRPSGGTINAATGVYTAGATGGVTDVVQVADSAASTATTNVTVTATVPVPVISAFTATPASIAAGASSTLAWTVTGATTLSIDQGIGAVTGTSRSVTPASTTTYTLTATNASGSATRAVTVTVAAPQVVVTGVSATGGDTTVTLSWSPLTGATSYNAYYSRTPGVNPATANKAANVGSPLLLTNATNGVTYYLVVTAVLPTGETNPSAEVSATPAAPVPVPTPSSSSKGCSTTGGADIGTLGAVSAFLLLRRRRTAGLRPAEKRG